MRINESLELLETHQLQLSVAWGQILFYVPQLTKDLKNIESIPQRLSWSERMFSPKIDYSLIACSEIQNTCQNLFSFAESHTLSLYNHSLIQVINQEDFSEKLPVLRDSLGSFLTELQEHWSKLSQRISQDFEICLNSHPQSVDRLSSQLENSLNTLEILQDAIRLISLSINFINDLIDSELRLLRINYA